MGYSPRFNADGWTWKKWLKGNWTTLKEMGKVAVPAVLSWVATKDPAYTAVVTAVGKLILDRLEYWLKDKEY